MIGVLRSTLVLLVAALVVTGAPRAAFAQAADGSRGQLTITVADSTGASVADAVVILTRGAERRTMTTGNDGTVRFANLGAGDWTVTVTRDGFARWQQVVSVNAGTLDVPVGLTVAGFSETVQVESESGPPTQIPLNAPATGGSRLDIPVRDLPASLFLVNQELIRERGARSVEEAVQLAVGMQATTNVGSIPAYAKRWHHYTGLVVGFFACMWAFSGALSLTPFQFLRGSPATRAFREAATGGPIDLTPLTVERVRASAATIGRSFTPRELDFFQFQGEPYFVAYVPPSAPESAPWRNLDIGAATNLNIDRERVLVSALRPEAGSFATFEKERMWNVAKAAMPGVPMQDAVWLNEYDAYYYSQKGLRPLPVLRIRYADPQQTWLYLDPQRGVIASRLERASRWNRWLYHGFHSLDFPFMYYKRPLWDIVVILLSLGGIAMSVTSAWPAWKRLARHASAGARRVLPLQSRLRKPLSVPTTGTASAASPDQLSVDA